jgi:hypothetical protein
VAARLHDGPATAIYLLSACHLSVDPVPSLDAVIVRSTKCFHPDDPQKDHTVFLVSSTPPLRNDLNQMVLHRPVELAGVLGNIARSGQPDTTVWAESAAIACRKVFGVVPQSSARHVVYI